MPVTPVPSPLQALAADTLLGDLLAVSITGLIYYRPIYDPAGSGEIVDFCFVYLNPTAQRMMRMPEEPTLTHNEQWPHSRQHGTFAFHVDAFVSGEPREYNINYQADGYDNYYRLAARRSGEGLWVSFTDTADQPRSPVELALREAQAREQTLRADAERERALLQAVVTQAPVGISLFQGAAHTVTLANDPVCAMWGYPAAQVVGRPLLEGVPELRGQGFTELLDEVARTGKPIIGTEAPAQLRQHGQLETHYFNFVYQPVYDAGGELLGIFDLVVDVTDQVRARQQLQQLNQELEARVQERAEQLEIAQAEMQARQSALLEAAQRRAQERETFYEVFEQTPALIALLRAPDHRFEFVNSAYQALFPGRQLVGLPLAEALPETVAQGFVALMDNVYQTGETYYGSEMQLTVTPPDGTPARDMYFTFTYQVYRENGVVAGVSIFAFEVTEQVVARRQREHERRQLLGLFTQAPAGICILGGPELLFEFVNPGFQLLLPGRELLGRPVMAAMPDIIGTPVAAILQRVYDTGQTHEEQALLIPLARPEDGTLENRYFSFVYQARRDEHGQVNGILVFVFEVTTQQQAAEAMRESEARFRIMADAAPNQVWAVNPDTTIRYANQAFLDFVGVSLEEYTATGWATYVPPQELAVAQHTLAEAIRTRSLYSLEHRMRRHDGQYRWLLAQGAPSFYPNGDLYGYVGSAIDITELKQTNEQLTRINQDLDNFVYAASHDLKQPVNNLAGLFEELRRSSVFPDPAEEKLLVPMLHEALQQLTNTIDDLAALGQAQQHRHAPTELVSLDELTEEVVNTLEPQVRAAQARITTDFQVRPALSFARANLRTILLNLLSNSLKYADPTRPARIHLSMWVELGRPVLVVEDNGLGFDAEKYGAELFHLFRRLHTHTAGTGVGLYLVNRIVEASGGSIEVDSQPGEGATFRIRFSAA